MKSLSSSKVYYLVVQGCNKVNNSKNSRLRFKIIDETQLAMELLEVESIYAPFR